MNFYLIRLRKNSVILYTEDERLHSNRQPEASNDSTNPVDRFIIHLSAKKGRTARFFRNLIVVVRDFYYKLEDKIDPMERVFKRMRYATELQLFYSPQSDESTALKKFEGLLICQKNKHAFWILVDSVFSVGALALTPFLVPIPGPNVFLYYPVLRMVSHYLAWRGTLHGLRLRRKSLVPLSEIYDIESILSQKRSSPELEKIHRLAQKLNLDHFPSFLERYS